MEYMSRTEFLFWKHEWNKSPWGERRADLRAALISWTIASSNCDKKFNLEDFDIENWINPGDKPDASLAVLNAMVAKGKIDEPIKE